MTRTSV